MKFLNSPEMTAELPWLQECSLSSVPFFSVRRVGSGRRCCSYSPQCTFSGTQLTHRNLGGQGAEGWQRDGRTSPQSQQWRQSLIRCMERGTHTSPLRSWSPRWLCGTGCCTGGRGRPSVSVLPQSSEPQWGGQCWCAERASSGSCHQQRILNKVNGHISVLLNKTSR